MDMMETHGKADLLGMMEELSFQANKLGHILAASADHIYMYDAAGRAGISKPYLSQIETGKRQGTVETLRTIARALDVPPDVLVG